MKKVIIGIMGLLLVVVMISGCTSSGDSTSNKMFNGSKMSFQYTADYNATESTAMDGMAILQKEGHEVTVEKMNMSLIDDSFSALLDGYTYSGMYRNNATNTTYKVYTMKDGNPTIYMFEKNGKVYEIIGGPLDLDVMEIIVETIK
jgi:hypothetical protein